MRNLILAIAILALGIPSLLALTTASANEGAGANEEASVRAEERAASMDIDAKPLLCGDLGDVLKNGTIGWGDFNAVVDHLRGTKKLGPQQKLRADVTGAGGVTWDDANAIWQHIKHGTPFGGCPLEYHTLTVSLSPDNPPAGNVPTGAGANALAVDLVPGAFDAPVTEFVFVRKGLSANQDIQTIHIVDENGFIRGVAKFNAEDEARVRFIPGYDLKAKTHTKFFARPFAAKGAASGRTFEIGLKSVSTTARVIGLDTPLWGNPFQIVSLTVGSAEAMEDGMVLDSTPNVGDTNVLVNTCKVVATSSVEPLIVENVSVLTRGSAPLGATSNIELVDATTGASLGEMPWDSKGRADWDTSITIPQGGSWRCRNRVDVFGGFGLSVNTDFADGDTVLMSIHGATYGYYILPDGDNADFWTNPNNGLAASNQTIQPPALEVRVPSYSPSWEIGPGCSALVVWEFIATGDQVKISSLPVGFDLQTMAEDEITSVRLRDASGNTLAGPWNVGTTDITGADGTTYEGSVNFTETIVLPRGETRLVLDACIADTVSTGDIIRVGIPNPASIVAEGMSRMSITPFPYQELNGNWMPVKLPELPYVTPRFSLHPSSPSGTLAPSVQTLLAKVSIAAPDSGDASFQQSDGNSFVTNVAIGGHAGEMTFIIKDEHGTTLDVVSVNPSETPSFLTDFSSAAFVIPANNTRVLSIYGNTLGFIEGGVVQLWWDDANPRNICWGIDGIGNYCHGEIVFRNGIFAGSLMIKP